MAKSVSERICRSIDQLLKRRATRKIFVGTILPGPFPKNDNGQTLRDRTGSKTNEYLRAKIPELYKDGRVVLIEYEHSLRQMGTEWRKLMHGAHPVKAGYKILADMAIPVFQKEMLPLTKTNAQKCGVKVVNLWDRNEQKSGKLIAGWYILSFETVRNDGNLEVSLKGAPGLRFNWSKSFKADRAKPGQRVEFEFMTGYEGYGYSRTPATIEVTGGEIKNIMLEKMRPSRKASIYGEGSFIDTVSPIYYGEILMPDSSTNP